MEARDDPPMAGRGWPVNETRPVPHDEAVRLAGDAGFVEALAGLFLEQLDEDWPPADRSRDLGVMLGAGGLLFDPRVCSGFRAGCEADARLQADLEGGGL